MYTPTILEKILNTLRHWVYKIVMPLYLWSIKQENLEEYINNVLFDEIVYNSSNIINTLKIHLNNNKLLFEDNLFFKQKLERLISSLEDLNN